MVKCYLRRTGPTTLQPVSEPDEEVIEALPYGVELQGELRRTRNSHFHRKFMALLRLGYQYFDPMPVHGMIPRKDFETFREWATIAAGYYETVGLPDGSVKVKAQSISFAKMDETEFSRLYSAMIDVMLQFLTKYGFTEQELRDMEQRVLEFDG